MADADQGQTGSPLTMRLSIPVARAFREIGTSVATQFARAAGFSDDLAAQVGADVARVTDQIAAGAPGDDGANLDIELRHESARGLEISIRRAGGEPAIVRLTPRP